ncbi:MAG: VOC family protein [Ahrensia sp.]|nr:VOC family protein [Ahrensia sp.]
MQERDGDFIWYELITTDISAANVFYSGLMDWTASDAGMPDRPYGMFSARGAMIAGALELTSDMLAGGAQPMWAAYLAVDDADAAAKRVVAAGGEILMQPWDIPDVGRITFVKAPDGALFYIMSGMTGEPSESFAAREPRVGHCAWNELASTDLVAAEKFYADLFGWEKAETIDLGEMGPYGLYKNGSDRDFNFGGFMEAPDGMPSMWQFYFRVADIDKAADFTAKNGGTILVGPIEIPGGEYSISGIDPQGAVFGCVGERIG